MSNEMEDEKETKRPPTNYREQDKQRERSFIWMALVALVGVGALVVGLVYDIGAVLTALPCLLLGAGLIALGYFLLNRLEKWLENRA